MECFLDALTRPMPRLNCKGQVRSCVKVEVTVLGSPSLIGLNSVSVDVKQHQKENKNTNNRNRAGLFECGDIQAVVQQKNYISSQCKVLQSQKKMKRNRKKKKEKKDDLNGKLVIILGMITRDCGQRLRRKIPVDINMLTAMILSFSFFFSFFFFLICNKHLTMFGLT